MNKAIIAALAGLAVGATGGYLACHFIEKRKIDKAISDGVQRALDEIRGTQKKKVIENDEKKSEMIKTTGRNINPIPHMSATSLVKDICKENGYIPNDQVEPEGKPDNGLPFEFDEPSKADARALELAEVKENIWDKKFDPENGIVTQEEYDAEQEPKVEDEIDMEKLDPTKPPYSITKEQYNEELQTATTKGMWDKVTLLFFKDNVFGERTALNDIQTMSAQEIGIAIGPSNVKKFVEDRSLGAIYIRNNKLQVDYEIIRSPRSYSSAINESEEAEE